MDDWVTEKISLSSGKERFLFFFENVHGVGDKINSTAAIREFKKIVPGSEIIVITNNNGPEVYKNNPYIDSVLPHNFINPVTWKDAPYKKGTNFVNCDWSYREQHEYGHVCSSYMHYIIGDYKGKDHSMEIYRNNRDQIQVNRIINNIRLAFGNEKKIMVIAPAVTKTERTLSVEYWNEITNILIKKGNIVVSVGNIRDFRIDNPDVIDLRDKLSINQIPYFLSFCEEIYTIQSGMLHIAGCNPHIKINLLNVGAFPPEMHWPYRQGEFGHNCEYIWHDCELKEDCFLGHIDDNEDGLFARKYKENINKYGHKYDKETIKKYTSHTWCININNRCICSDMVGKKIIKKLKED